MVLRLGRFPCATQQRCRPRDVTHDHVLLLIPWGSDDIFERADASEEEGALQPHHSGRFVGVGSRFHAADRRNALQRKE